MHYLDNAATTKPSPPVLQAVAQTLQQQWANPSSLYAAGLRAKEVMTAARGQLASVLGCGANEVFFTAGGTEANNIALLGAARARAAWANHIVATGYEHPSVQGPLRMLAKREGFALTEIAPEPDGNVDIAKMIAAVGPKTALVTAMQVNNESGAVIDVATLAAAVKAKNPRCFVHVDGVQGFCKLPLRFASTRIDSYAISGHKLHAPKGVGALVLKAGSYMVPVMTGGGQEDGIRPGTENTAYIAGFGLAAALAAEARPAAKEHIAALRARLLGGLAGIDGIRLHTPTGGYNGIVLFSMPKGLRSQVMLNFLDETYNVCVSSGSACSGGAASRTLSAMGVHADEIDTAIRASFDGETTEDDIDALLAGLAEGAKRLVRG